MCQFYSDSSRFFLQPAVHKFRSGLFLFFGKRFYICLDIFWRIRDTNSLLERKVCFPAVLKKLISVMKNKYVVKTFLKDLFTYSRHFYSSSVSRRSFVTTHFVLSSKR
jgi:hypothetical protein